MSGTSASASGRPPQPRTAGEMLAMARAFLERKGLDEARLEAELLCAHALGIDRLRLFLRLEQPIESHEVDAARDLLVRRGRREPVAYITGKREFYGREFAVGPGVLIPRPETEQLIDLAREFLADREAPLVAEFGCGSGCIAVTLALELPGSHVVTCDLSTTAVAQTRLNAERLGADVETLIGDGLSVLGERLRREAPRGLDLLVSNPPYVDPASRPELQPEVRDYEPELALYAPEGDVDHWVKQLLAAAKKWLAPRGALLVELGAGRGKAALAAAEAAGFDARLHQDLARIDRVLEARPRA
ncbi:MAG: peptide chain release factor N(5)-glutamine methyltransferase [Planctomycetes bacterium]|nr:peptide chain release factor N(5)-glutamine methyltransferase [Planctomycetota bacterium]